MKKLLPLLCAAAVSVLACSKSEAPAPAPAASGKPASAAAPAATAAGAATSDAIEIDLSSADPAWKGWVAKGPAAAKVLADGVHGARIAANGMDAFDLAFAPSRTTLKDVKSGIDAGVKGSDGKLKVSYLVDTADKLEWMSEGYGTKTWNFVWNYKASGKDVSCSTNAAMGVSSEALLAELKQACATLRKK